MRFELAIAIVLGCGLWILPASSAHAEPDAAVALAASIFADFEASPTLVRTRPDLFGGSNSVFSTGDLEEESASDSFREIYQGVGESGTSLFEADFGGSASLNTGVLRVDVSATDQNNASASWWTMGGSASAYEWLEFDGPTDASGDYVVTFTTNLGSFSAQNTQPPGFTFIWKANASTQLVAEPVELGYPTLQIGAFAFLKEDCPSMAQPPCFGTSRLTSATGDVSVPGSNPVLRVAHWLSVSLRSTSADLGGASLDMSLPPGVTYTRHQQAPEPSSLHLGLAAIAVLGVGGVRAGRGQAQESSSARE